MIKGLDELKAQLKRISELDRSKALLAGALILQRYSMENAPVKTGFLRNSHEARQNRAGAELVVKANYAYYVEFGTKKWSGKPYVRPAMDTKGNEIAKAVGEQVENQIREKI